MLETKWNAKPPNFEDIETPVVDDHHIPYHKQSTKFSTLQKLPVISIDDSDNTSRDSFQLPKRKYVKFYNIVLS